MTEFLDRAATAIVVPTHNGIRFTLRLLDSLASMDGPAAMVVLVDDGSTDGTAEAVASAQPDVLVLPTADGDLWWSGAVDVGCRFAIQRGAERLLLLNNDDVVPPDLLVTMSAEFERIGGLVGSVYRSAPDPAAPIIESCGVIDWAGRGISLRSFTAEEESRGTARCDWLPGACLMFASALYTEVGGFDGRRFPQYRGDIDFSLRARRLGHECTATSAAWVYNDPAQSWTDSERPISLPEFLRGFWSYRSNFNLRESVRFAWRYCPRRLVPYYLARHYARWPYVFVKSQLRRRAPGRPR